MTAKKYEEFESVSEIIKRMQENKNQGKNIGPVAKKTTIKRTPVPTTSQRFSAPQKKEPTEPIKMSIYRPRESSDDSLSISELIKREQEKANRKKTEEKKGIISIKEKKYAKEDKKKKIKKPTTKTKEKAKEKTKEKSQKIKQREKKKSIVLPKKKDKNITYIRWTEPKKRNLLSKIIWQSRFARGYFDYLEDDLENGDVTKIDVEKSKVAKKRSGRALYREVQNYEDARDDVTTRKGWRNFKIGLAAVALSATLTGSLFLANEVKQTFVNPDTYTPQIEYVQLATEEQNQIRTAATEFRSEIRDNDGYEFDHLTDLEFEEAYYRISKQEGKMSVGSFKGAMLSSNELSFYDSIVKRAYGEDKFANFSEEQRKDYRQLAYELIPISVNNDKDISFSLRNPIVLDELQARDSAREKGYEIQIKVNNDEKATVANIGRLIHIINTTSVQDFESSSSHNSGITYLEYIVKQALGNETYSELDSKGQRDYLQVAYELLPGTVKDNYIMDPIVVEILNARDAAQQKGYSFGINIEEEMKKDPVAFGKIVDAVSKDRSYMYTGTYTEKQSEMFLDMIAENAIGLTEYKKLDDKTQKDYLQLVYQLLPEKARDLLTDPMTVARSTDGMER